jgi:recombination protein RecA
MEHVTAGSRFAVQATAPTTKTCIGMHPRMEENGMATALEGLLQARDSTRMSGKPGTPGALNRPLGALPAKPRVEQIATDRLPARRGEHALEQKSRLAAGENGVVTSLSEQAATLARVAPRCAETQQGFARAKQARVVPVAGPTPLLKPQQKATNQWDRLDQAIRATDLLLQAGGFSCIVLDLSGVAAEFANRIPLATWFRFRAAADRTRASLIVLTQHASTGSSGELLLRTQAREPAGTTVMTHVPLHVELARQRFAAQPAAPVQQGNVVTMRKPPRSVATADLVSPCASLKAAGVAR